MTDTSVIEGNKIIALFHGWRHVPTSKGKGKGYWNFPEWGKASWDADSFLYHSSWDWLMPVVEKIGNTHNIRIQINVCSITRRFLDHRKYQKEHNIGFDEVPPIAEHDGSGFIENVWHAVVKFIKWYNSQKEVNHG